MSTNRIEKKSLLHALRQRVWRALADSTEFGRWFGVKFDGAASGIIPLDVCFFQRFMVSRESSQQSKKVTTESAPAQSVPDTALNEPFDWTL